MSDLAKFHAQSAMQPNNMAHDEITSRLQDSFYTQNALATLLGKPDMKVADVMHVLADFVADGKMSASEAHNIGGSLPANETALRHLVSHLQQVAIHASLMLVSEQVSRGAVH